MRGYRSPIGFWQPFHAARKYLAERGVRFVVRLTLLYLTFPLWRRLLQRRYFLFKGAPYEYFLNNHNITWSNERAVEIPIALELVRQFKGQSILEVGNVLSHYLPISHPVVDKYEIASGVMNKDILDLIGTGPYDLILCVSTIEHVGWDEIPKQPGKALAALQVLVDCLASDGRLLVTFPVGYNEELDKSLLTGVLSSAKFCYLKRIGDLKWVQTNWTDVQGCQYDKPYLAANAVAIGLISRDQIVLQSVE